MNLKQKLRVAVLYGGRSTEHEVSLRSAASVLRHLDRNRYDVLPIAIDMEGRFHRMPLPDASVEVLLIDPHAPTFSFAPEPFGMPDIDVVFPVVHGPLCEDGSLQGMLELASVPYVGSRVLGSALCMDKDITKRLVQACGIAIAPHVTFRSAHWHQTQAELIARIAAQLGPSVFVKPATLGSSVGVSRANTQAELVLAVQEALRFDDKVLVETAIDAREIEVAVLAAEDDSALPDASLPGEIVAREAFYSFDRKYIEAAGADLHVPARLDAAQTALVRSHAQRIFLALECEGMARIDFFLDRQSGALMLNEVNTIPGFTSISMYPKLWDASGLGYSALLDRLITDAMTRHTRRAALRRKR